MPRFPLPHADVIIFFSCDHFLTDNLLLCPANLFWCRSVLEPGEKSSVEKFCRVTFEFELIRHPYSPMFLWPEIVASWRTPFSVQLVSLFSHLACAVDPSKWGSTDAEIKVSFAENPDLSKLPSLRLRVAQNTALQAFAGLEARLCRGWLSPGRATRISHKRNPNEKYSRIMQKEGGKK